MRRMFIPLFQKAVPGERTKLVADAVEGYEDRDVFEVFFSDDDSIGSPIGKHKVTFPAVKDKTRVGATVKAMKVWQIFETSEVDGFFCAEIAAEDLDFEVDAHGVSFRFDGQ